MIAFSYTHLDVYKRQSIDNIFPVFRFLFLQFQVFFDDVVRISCLVGLSLIHIWMKAKAIAGNLKNAGLSIAEIAKVTGLSEIGRAHV